MNYKLLIETLQKEKNLTMPELAKKIGVPLRTLESWKSGSRVPDASAKSLLNHFKKCNNF